MRTRTPLSTLLLGALLLTGCTVGPDPAPPDARTGLKPHIAPKKKQDGRPSEHGKPTGKGHPDRPNDPATPSVTPAAGHSPDPTAPDHAAPSDGTSATPAEPSSARASVADPAGDVGGLAPPGFADLRGATVTRDGDRFALEVEAAAAYPTSSNDRTMHVVFFVDRDGDGQVDYEIWGTLADDGWSGSWRYPDGAKFGSASGVQVQPDGSTLRFGFAADHVGGARSFRWVVGAEYGTFEQQASGTMSEDYAPDTGAAAFPGV